MSNFSELLKPDMDNVEGFPGVYVKQGTYNELQGLVKLDRDAEEKKDEEGKIIPKTDEENRENQLKMIRYLFKHYIRDENGGVFDDMVGPNAKLGEAHDVLIKRVSHIIIDRLEKKRE